MLFCLLRSSLACIRGSLKRDLTETPNAHDICEAVTSARIAVNLDWSITSYIHHFLYAQPTPVDICHLTKFLMPFIYPFLIWSTTSFSAIHFATHVSLLSSFFIIIKINYCTYCQNMFSKAQAFNLESESFIFQMPEP